MSCTPGRVVSKVRELNLPQETSMRSLILPRLTELGLWNPRNFCLWNLESGKF